MLKVLSEQGQITKKSDIKLMHTKVSHISNIIYFALSCYKVNYHFAKKNVIYGFKAHKYGQVVFLTKDYANCEQSNWIVYFFY